MNDKYQDVNLNSHEDKKEESQKKQNEENRRMKILLRKYIVAYLKILSQFYF